MPNKPLTQQAHDMVMSHLTPGATAIDMTAGNGYDTLFLAQAVAQSGKVYSFDIQQQAIESTRQRLEKHACHNAVLICDSHANMKQHLPGNLKGEIQVVMFNLGYLPRGDKNMTTTAQSTLTALDTVLNWLAIDGIISLLVYVGHPAGQQEGIAIKAWLTSLPEEWQWQWINQSCSELSPRLYTIHKQG